MRGENTKQSKAFFYFSPEDRVPTNHPLRSIKVLLDKILDRLEPVFSQMYSDSGRPSVPPETLLKSSILMALYTVRSERLFCEMLDYNILFRWFLDIDLEAASFDHSTFSKNRERLLLHNVSREFFSEVVKLIREKKLASNEHFTVDGTLIESLASLKSFQPKGEKSAPPSSDGDVSNPSIDFRGQKRCNDTHESKTDPEARLAKKVKGSQAKMCHMGHILMENRNGFCVDVEVTTVTGDAEPNTAIEMIDRMKENTDIVPSTLGADANYYTEKFVDQLREREITPHIATRTCRPSVKIDGRTTRHETYQVSQRKRKLVEENFGWFKTIGGMRKMRLVGRSLTAHWMELVAGTYDLIRLAKCLSYT